VSVVILVFCVDALPRSALCIFQGLVGADVHRGPLILDVLEELGAGGAELTQGDGCGLRVLLRPIFRLFLEDGTLNAMEGLVDQRLPGIENFIGIQNVDVKIRAAEGVSSAISAGNR